MVSARGSFVIFQPLHDEFAMPLESMDGLLQGVEHRHGDVDVMAAAHQLFNQPLLLGDMLVGSRDMAIRLGWSRSRFNSVTVNFPCHSAVEQAAAVVVAVAAAFRALFFGQNTPGKPPALSERSHRLHALHFEEIGAIEKSTPVTVAIWPCPALFSLASLSSVVSGAF